MELQGHQVRVVQAVVLEHQVLRGLAEKVVLQGQVVLREHQELVVQVVLQELQVLAV